ncbi:hypothetical protein HanRHA438_Chr01g0038101 [Helianthus annuus]|uniref:Uncharacterized protein n=1 Tax=Helianthus annuus TaxID=4232 RepID=A0A9K3P455_HELAN|nr:hypothetical protein HanXRQr2_Chr01g0037301 [Helianthus annuus]KAJ0949387.1 hypothetical protein HanRHA438_Chr01g0038101 [Helianthus annuus]
MVQTVCGPHLQASAREDVNQMSVVCKEKRICFLFTSTKTTSQHTHNTPLSLSLSSSTNTDNFQKKIYQYRS